MHREFTIAICDDERIHLDKLMQQTNCILSEEGFSFSIDPYLSEHALLTAISDTPERYDVILLDILLGNQNGIDIAHQLRKCGCRAAIVFVTTTADYAVKGYEVDAYRYLLKPIEHDQLQNTLLSIYNRQRTQDWVTLQKGGEVRKVRTDSIRYIETGGRGVMVHTQTDDMALSDKISDIEQVLPQATLVRCHKSYIVNVTHIERIDRNSITLLDQAIIPVGRKYYDQVRRALMRYLAR
ncbi:LytTR family DNA-binding domain-containing protein [Eubacteriales bacterium OttesenSCG-928-N14]|nr:LytTR family DNA-binding domain-containing protein [Eubacteriales bacterium OttesenSCG-928-N14]